ncbi:hypothetical protein [Paenibacillus sp. GCM10012303]|uniref:hypothetical protein n=1 Tax=Paenibacillus sp. GCM10012303 TaxID=3317340 RepID=UPI0036D331DD
MKIVYGTREEREYILHWFINPKMGIHIKYFSRKFGILVDFPWWDHADKDIRQYNEENIPLGTLDSPYIDFEES